MSGPSAARKSKSRLETEMRTFSSYSRCSTFVSMSRKMAAPSAIRNSPPLTVAGLKHTNAPKRAVFLVVACEGSMGGAACAPTRA